MIVMSKRPVLVNNIEANTYGSGSINATFASDILRLQDLWTGIMWSLLSPLSRVLITIIYAFSVSPQARILENSIEKPCKIHFGGRKCMKRKHFRHCWHEVGVLALSVFPIIFVTVPQGSSSALAASYSMAAAETIDIFQNGVSCQRMLWQCDRQHYWFLNYLPLARSQSFRRHLGCP